MDDKNKRRDTPRKAKSIFEPLGQCFIRIPTLPIETLSIEADGVEMVKHNQLLHEALFIASMSLVESLPRLQTSSPKKGRQLRSSVLRYGIRMSTRTTPFGLFAGVAQVPIGAHTSVSLRRSEERRHRTRFDMEWLLGYLQTLENDPKIQPDLVYTYLPSFVRIGRYYYFEHRNTDGILTNTSIAATSGVEALIQKARGGMKYTDLLQQMLAAIPEATSEEMTVFLHKFIRYGVLYSSLRPPLTCADPSRYVVKHLSGIPAARTVSRRLRDLRKGLARYDACVPGEGEDTLRKLADEANQIHPAPDGRIPFDIDLMATFTETPSLQYSLASDAARLAELLLKCSDQDPARDRLSSYRQAFVAKYGRHRLVPVLEVLNQSIGLGLPTHYGGDVQHHRRTRLAPRQSDRDALLFKLALKAIHCRQTILNLTDAMVGKLTNRQFEDAHLPQSLDIAVQIAASSQEQVNAGNYLLVSSPLTGAQPAGRLAGRFADMLGTQTIDYLQSIATQQASHDPNRLHAELVYIPQRGHAANVAIRPPLQQYEITVGAASGVAPNQTIPLSDMYVGIRDDRLCLWSATHQKEIAVQAGHVLNMVHAPSICRFLIDISKDMEIRLTAFSWGSAAWLPMLPRVQYGLLVLSLATWELNIQEILDIPDEMHGQFAVPDAAVWHEEIRAWRKDWCVPRFVFVGNGDNRLLLDLDVEAHTMELLYMARSNGKSRPLRLQEALPGPEDAWIAGPDGRYVNECIFQLVRTSFGQMADRAEPGLRPVAKRPQQGIAAAERVRLPGSDWLYCKLYVPIQQQNECLASYVEPLARAAVERYGADSWFFIRYTDPDPHIRLRFKAKSIASFHVLLPMVIAWAEQLQGLGVLQSFSIDSYSREIERYGGLAAINTAEAIFAVESKADVQLIQLSENGNLSHILLSDLAVLTTTILLSAFGIDDAQQVAWARGRLPHEQFAQEYRKDRQRILSLVYEYRASEVPQQEVLKVCKQLEEELRPLGQVYRALEADGELVVPLQQILASFVHMHCNRLLGIDKLFERCNIAYVGRILSDMPKWQRGLAFSKKSAFGASR